MSNIAIITARGNNESIPDKNIIKIVGKPAVGYAIDAAYKSKLIDDVFISTNCEKISRVGQAFGCKIIMRPAELALPDTNHGDVIAHAVRVVKDEYYPDLKIVTVLLGNTVMVTPELIDLSIKILEKRSDIDSVMSVWQAQDDHPYRALKMNDKGLLESFLNVECGTSRQYYPKVYFYDQGVWTFRYWCVFEKKGPNPWWWMGERCFPIIRRWVTGRDFHTDLDIRISEFWLTSNEKDIIENIEDIKKILEDDK